jgi:hypothetical protein
MHRNEVLALGSRSGVRIARRVRLDPEFAPALASKMQGPDALFTSDQVDELIAVRASAVVC